MPAGRGGSAVALAAVSAATVAGYSRLFADDGWVIPAAAALSGAHGVGWLCRRLPGGRAALAHGGGLLLLLTWTAGGHTAAGFPTPATFSALAEAFTNAAAAFREAIVPAPRTPELTLWVVAGTWVCAGLAERLARRGAGLAAVVPLAVVQVLVAALGTARFRGALTFAFAGSVCAFAAAERAGRLPRGRAEIVRRKAPVPTGPWRSRLGRRVNWRSLVPVSHR